MAKLRYFLGYNRGLHVFEGDGAGPRETGAFFDGITLEDLTGPPSKPHVLFAGTAWNGGWRSRDAGRTWEQVLPGDVRTFSFDPLDDDIVYAGTGPIRLYRSDDGGTTWAPLDGMLDLPDDVKTKWDVPFPFRGKEQPHVRHIHIHPEDSRQIFVLLEHGGVLLTNDGGTTWSDRSNGIDYVDMHMIGNYPGSKDTYFVSSAQGFYRTDDRGAHWTRAEHGMPWADKPEWCYSHEWRFVDAGGPRMVVCGSRGSPGVWGMDGGTPGGHILLSDDGGKNWRTVTHDMDKWVPWVLAPHPHEAHTLFCGAGDGARGYFLNTALRGDGALYASRDAGETWEPVLRDLPAVQTARVIDAS